MATKSITITTDAYEGLASFKEKNESFSDVINKLTRRNSLSALIGVLSKKEAEELKENIRKTRTEIEKRMNRTERLLK